MHSLQPFPSIAEVASVSGANEESENAVPLHAEETNEGVYCHPEARALFNRAPCLRTIPIFATAAEGYGPKPVLSLGLSFFMFKGVAHFLIRESMLAMLTRRFGVDGMVYQRLANLSRMGWSLKPVAAVVSDMFPFFGYTKRWYMLASCIAGAAFSLGYALLPPVRESAQKAAVLVFLSSFTKAVLDILLEGHYSRMMRRLPGPGPALVSWIWCFVMIGSLISVTFVGPLSDAKLPHILAFMATGLQLLTCVFFIFNWHGELTNREERLEDARIMYKDKLKEDQAAVKPQNSIPQKEISENGEEMRADPDGDMLGYSAVMPYGSQDGEVMPFEFEEPRQCCCGVFEINAEVCRRNLRVTVYSILMACCVVTVAVVSILGTKEQLLYTAIAVSVVHCGFNFYAFPLIIAKANLFSFLQTASALRYNGPLSQFYTASPDCLPDGPHFNFFFYQTVSGIIGSLASLVGIILFNYVCSKRTYRMTFFATVLLGSAASIFDFVIVMRWNRPHVSDHIVYIFGDAIVTEMINMLNSMPLVVLLSRLCPRGSESMVYSILAASGAIGQSMGSIIGSLIMEYRLPVKTRIPCDFSNLMWLIIICSFLVPLVQIPMIFLLIPAGRMCDPLDLNEGKTIQIHKENINGKETPEDSATSREEEATSVKNGNNFPNK